MGRIDLYEIAEELKVFLVNNITDPSSRATSATYTGTATAGQTVITISVAAVQAITSVTIAGNLKTYGTDYSVAYSSTSAVVTMTSGMTVGDSISIPYKKGTQWIYPDWPKDSLNQASYPRLSILFGEIITTPSGLGGSGNMNMIPVNVTVFSEKVKETLQIAGEIRDKFASNKKNFYNFNFIDIAGMSPVLPAENRKGEVTYCTVKLRIPLKYETNT
jgi:hypothetical protein